MQDIKTQEQKTKLQKNSVPADKVEKTPKKERKMDSRFKRLAKAIVFVLILVLLLGQFGEMFAFKGNAYETNNYYDFDYLYDLPKDSLDVVYVGTSQYHMGITPLEIWKEYGITGASFNAPLCRARLSYYMIKEVLKYQSPKVIVLDAAVARGGTDQAVVNRRTISQFKLSPLKFQALYDCLELKGKTIDEMINTAFQFFAYHDKWNQLGEKDFTGDSSSLAYQKGYLLTTDCTPYSEMDHEENQKATFVEMDETTFDYMNQIKQLCDENGIDLMLAKLPSDMWNSTYARIVRAWADNNDVVFLDLTQNQFQRQMHFDKERSYFDGNHMNHVGAETVSSFLGSYLTEHYQFESHSQEVEDAWEADYETYEAYRNLRIMKSTEDLSEFAELANNPNYIICLSIKDDATRGLTENEYDILQGFGLNMRFADRYRTSLAAVIDGGSVVAQKDGNFALSCEYEPYANCEIQVESAGYNAGNKSSIVINGKEYSKNKRGLNVVVYDKTTDKVICSTVFDTWLMESER